MRSVLLDCPPDKWGDLFSRQSLPKFRFNQIASWIFKKGETDWSKMHNLSRELQSFFELETTLRLPEVVESLPATDGTVKLVLRLHDGQMIESVIIPRGDRATLCLSSQVGCAIGCRFCRTAEMGLIRNLTLGEILGQMIVANRFLEASPIRDLLAPDDSAAIPLFRINHVVFMGMGEPLANLDNLIEAIQVMTSPGGFALSPRRITVSTSGLPSRIGELGRTGLCVNLAVSLTAADDETREKLMPINRHYPIQTILDACRNLPLKKRQRVTFEYVLLSGVNDRPEDARKLSRLLAPFRSKVNLIPFNPYEGSPFKRPSHEDVLAFQRILLDKSVVATIRKSRGADVLGACGQLAWEKKKEQKESQWNPVVFST